MRDWNTLAAICFTAIGILIGFLMGLAYPKKNRGED